MSLAIRATDCWEISLIQTWLVCFVFFFREQQEAKQLGWAEGGDALSAPGLGRSWDVGEE